MKSPFHRRALFHDVIDGTKLTAIFAALVAALVLLPVVPASAGHGTNLPYGGVNTHLTYNRTKYNDYEYVAQKLKQVEAKLYRDAINPGQPQAYYDRFATAVRRIRTVSGARLDALFVRADQTPAQIDQILDQLAPLIAEGHVVAIEGANEWDNAAGRTDPDWAIDIRAHQCELHKQVKARWPRMTVIGPSLSYKRTGSYVGDLSHCMDVGNFHYYAHPNGIYAPDLVARWDDKAIVAGWADGSGDPMISTESNGVFGDNVGGTEQTQAQGMKDLYTALGGLKYGGAHRVFAYELLQPSDLGLPLTHSENNYGLFRSDGSIKPVFYPVLDANRRR